MVDALVFCEDNYITVEGIRIRYWVLGERRPAIVLLHGLASSVEFWGLNIETLSREHQVYALDVPGFGRSKGPTEPLTANQAVGLLNAFFTRHKLDDVILVGSSMGGGLAIQYALSYPENIKKLVLVASGGLGTELPLFMRLINLPFPLIVLPRPGKRVIRQKVGRITHDPGSFPEELIEVIYQQYRSKQALTYAMKMLRDVSNLRGLHPHIIEPVMANIHRIDIPVLLIWGKEDRILPIAHVSVVSDKIPKAYVQVIDNCGHLPHIEYPERFNSLVLDFLSS